ncbi:MAG TPA: ribonuclease H-like domain-containing protein, partial [Candidatus Eisenbacteria bacterium]
MGDSTLRARLGELTRARRLRGAAPAPAAPARRRPERAWFEEAREAPGPPRDERVGVEAFLPGGEWRGPMGAVFVHECLRSQVERPRAHWGRLVDAPSHEREIEALARLGLEHALFLDLETCGLISSTVFLAGTMQWNGSDFVLRQYFARHYGEEAALLAALGEGMRGAEYLITFNGKSY